MPEISPGVFVDIIHESCRRDLIKGELVGWWLRFRLIAAVLGLSASEGDDDEDDDLEGDEVLELERGWKRR